MEISSGFSLMGEKRWTLQGEKEKPHGGLLLRFFWLAVDFCYFLFLFYFGVECMIYIERKRLRI